MARPAFRYVLAACLILALWPTQARAQSLTTRLSTLLTEDETALPSMTDRAARDVTRDTLIQLFKTELVTLPVAASAGGFVYRLNSQLGVVERASEGFGGILTERTLLNSRGQTAVGFSVQFSTFGSLQGADLLDGSFPAGAARTVGQSQPSSVDLLSLRMEVRSTTVFASHGLTDRLTVGAAAPLTTLRFSGQRATAEALSRTIRSTQSGSASGLGDISVQGRYLLAGSGRRGVAAGADLRLPTGRAGDFLGAGRAAGRMLGIASLEEGPLALNMNVGFSVGGVSREVSWSNALAVAVAPRVTVAAEAMVRITTRLARIKDVYEPSIQSPGVETMRWLAVDDGVRASFVVVGAKWNIAGSWLLNASVLMRVTEAGLKSRVTPILSLDRAFQR